MKMMLRGVVPIVIIYTIFSVLAFGSGLSRAGYSECREQRHSRIRRLFPAYDFGCYMGVAPPEEAARALLQETTQ